MQLLRGSVRPDGRTTTTCQDNPDVLFIPLIMSQFYPADFILQTSYHLLVHQEQYSVCIRSTCTMQHQDFKCTHHTCTLDRFTSAWSICISCGSSSAPSWWVDLSLRDDTTLWDFARCLYIGIKWWNNNDDQILYIKGTTCMHACTCTWSCMVYWKSYKAIVLCTCTSSTVRRYTQDVVFIIIMKAPRVLMPR